MSKMTEREMIEFAAKAAAIGGGWDWPRGAKSPIGWRDASGKIWQPLHDDGDNRRLQIACGLSIEPYPYYDSQKHSVIVKQRRHSDKMREANPTECIEVYGSDPCAATRLAVTRSAAEIGKAMP